MIFESSLLTQINVENPLPTLVEVEISRSLNTSLRRAFLFFYVLAAEKLSILAPLIPYGDEMYLVLNGLFERFLIFHADTTFTELMFGLRRVRVIGRRYSVVTAGVTGWKEGLRYLVCGPAPMASAEERAVDYIAILEMQQEQQQQQQQLLLDVAEGSSSGGVVGIGGAPAHIDAFTSNSNASSPPSQPFSPAVDLASLTGGPDAVMGSSRVGSGGGGMGLGGGGGEEEREEEFKAGEIMSASRASYGYLRLGPLRRNQRLISLFLLTLKPYAEKKLKMLYVAETDTAPDAVAMREAYASRYPMRAELKCVFFGIVFPIFHVLSKAGELVFKVLYLCELSPYTSPYHRLFNIVVKRGSPEESASMTPQARRALALVRVLVFVVFFSFQVFEFTRSVGITGGSLLEGSDEGILPIPDPPVWGLDVKDIRRYHGNSNGGISRRSSSIAANQDDSTSTLAGSINPDPGGGGGGGGHWSRQQQRLEASADSIDNIGEAAAADGDDDSAVVNVTPGHCPVCSRAVTNAAVLTTSGILGCYPCLQQYVREHRLCPATGRQTTVEQIRRVFEC